MEGYGKQTPTSIAAPIYDTKPVHFLTESSDYVEEVVNKRKLLIQEQSIYAEINHLCLKLIAVYNLRIGMVDISYQLQLQHRVDLFMRSKKWW